MTRQATASGSRRPFNTVAISVFLQAGIFKTLRDCNDNHISLSSLVFGRQTLPQSVRKVRRSSRALVRTAAIQQPTLTREPDRVLRMRLASGVGGRNRWDYGASGVVRGADILDTCG